MAKIEKYPTIKERSMTSGTFVEQGSGQIHQIVNTTVGYFLIQTETGNDVHGPVPMTEMKKYLEARGYNRFNGMFKVIQN